MSKPIKVGVTGGIGAGKSTVCKIFAALGAPVYNADDRAKWLQLYNKELKRDIEKNFGKKAYLEEGQLNKAFLAETVFSDPEKLALINSLVHPKVAEDFADWLAVHQEKPYIIKEAALMIESGSYKSLDFLINVAAPEEIRINRVMLRDMGRSMEQIKGIIASQLSDAVRKKTADVTIMNDEASFLIPYILKLHEKWIKN